AFLGVYGASVVELKSELNLPRIVRSIARRTDFAEGRAVVVARVGDGHNTVAAEVRCVEVRVVGDVKDFRTELQAETLLDREVLEEGQIEPVEAGSRNLRDTAECRSARQRRAAGRGIGNWYGIWSEDARLCECSRVAEPAEFAVSIVVQPELEGRARDQSAAAP